MNIEYLNIVNMVTKKIYHFRIITFYFKSIIKIAIDSCGIPRLSDTGLEFNKV